MCDFSLTSVVIDKLYCIEYTSPRMEFELITLVKIGTDCIKAVVNPTTIRSRPNWMNIKLLKVALNTINHDHAVFVGTCIFSTNSFRISTVTTCDIRKLNKLYNSRVPGENHRPIQCHWQTLSHNVVSSTPRHEQDLSFNGDMYW
jgi:hypothetical protein